MIRDRVHRLRCELEVLKLNLGVLLEPLELKLKPSLELKPELKLEFELQAKLQPEKRFHLEAK